MPVDIIIRKQAFRIKTRSSETALQVRRQLNQEWHYQFLQRMEKIAGQFQLQEDINLYIEKVAVSLNTTTPTDLTTLSLQGIEEEVYKAINNQILIRQTGETNAPPAEKTDDETALFYFLQQGFLPWWYKSGKTPPQLIEALMAAPNESFLQRLMGLTKSSEQTARRFVQHLPANFLRAVIAKTGERHCSAENAKHLSLLLDKNTSKVVCAYYSLSKPEYHRHLLCYLLTSSAGENFLFYFFQSLSKENRENQSWEGDATRNASALPFWNSMVQAAGGQNGLQEAAPGKEHIALPDTKKNASFLLAEEGIYIQNAGAILFHPFLASFFEAVGLLNAQWQFLSIAGQHRAAALFQYLQSLDDRCNEWEMPLTKILCGLPVNAVLPEAIGLTDREKNECREVLLTMVQHWEALRGASPEAMLGTFVQRTGKISFKNDHWLLQVERNAADILLNRLPWGFGVVRLPWLNNLIYTEW